MEVFIFTNSIPKRKKYWCKQKIVNFTRRHKSNFFRQMIVHSGAALAVS